MKRKLNIPILGLFAALEEIASGAHDKIDRWGFTARKKQDRPKQTPADPEKKAQRKTVEASRRGNRR